MALYHFFIVITMKVLIKFLNIMGKEAGTLPGRISLIICKNIRDYIKFEGKIIVITGTNGKTTTNNLFYEILKREGKKVICNISGNNIDRGITSLLLKNCDLLGRVNADYLLLETEECYIPLIYSAKNLQINSLVILNLFDDQLDRFGEVDNVVKSLEKFIINYKGKLVLNGDDPNVVKLGSKAEKAKIFYYGVEAINRSKREKRETVLCPLCQNKLAYDFYFYSNIGSFNCSNCGFGNVNLKVNLSGKNVNVVGFENSKNVIVNTNNYFGKIIGCSNKKVINKYDGFFIENVLCTNLNGPLFSKNPELADWIIKLLLDRKYKCNIKLKNIDDKLEIIAKNNIINNIKKVNV